MRLHPIRYVHDEGRVQLETATLQLYYNTLFIILIHFKFVYYINIVHTCIHTHVVHIYVYMYIHTYTQTGRPLPREGRILSSRRTSLKPVQCHDTESRSCAAATLRKYRACTYIHTYIHTYSTYSVNIFIYVCMYVCMYGAENLADFFEHHAKVAVRLSKRALLRSVIT